LSDHPIDVDIRVYGAAEVPELIERGHDLISWCLRFGYLICERGEYWSSLRREWNSKAPLPNAEIAAERERKAAALYEQLNRLGDAEAAHEQLLSVLTHRAWARLLRRGIHPASRPELPSQLRSIGEESLAAAIEQELGRRDSERDDDVGRKEAQ
jgi:hypothetical protein